MVIPPPPPPFFVAFFLLFQQLKTPPLLPLSHPLQAPWATTQGDLPRHSVAAYIEKGGPPCDPSAAAGELAHTSTMKVVTDAGAVVEVPRVKSGLDLGHNAPYYQTVSMAASGQTDAYNQKRRGFCPEARPLSLVKNHPAISAARAARGI